MSKQKSLMFKLMIWINVVSVVVIMALSGAIMYNMMKSTDEMVTKEMATLANSVSLTSADYVWNLNSEVLKKITTQLLEDPSIEAVKFIDSKKVVLTEAQKKDSTQSSLREIRLPIVYGAEKEVVAFLELKYNLNKVVNVRNDFIKMTFAGILIAQFLMCTILFFVLRKTTINLGNVTAKIRVVTEKNQNSAEVVQVTSEEVSASTQEQSSSIQETVSTLEQITSMVNTSVESAKKSSEKAEESHTIATEGQGVVKEMINSMDEISMSNKNIMDEIQKSNERIGGIVKVINEISQKTSVINDIVFQTKLLSFNASVEAARAGEHGKGFSVVAEEVGNLAQMSGTASNEISQMLDDSIKKVNEIIYDTDRSIKELIEIGNRKIEGGVLVADKCGKVLEEVVVNASIVKNMMNEVSLASKEQAEGVRNISLAMNQLDQTTLKNASTASRSFQSSKELLIQADELRNNVEELDREIFGSKGFKVQAAPSANTSKDNKLFKTSVEVKVLPNKIKQSNEKVDPASSITVTGPKPKAVLAATKLKVVKEEKEHSSPVPVVGKSLSVPSSTDSRFEDV